MQFIKTIFFALLSLFSSICAVGQGIQFVNKVYEYKPAPGQFINTPLGFPAAAQSIVGEMQSGVSLGAFGGYIVVGFEKPIENDPDNPYGIDFTVFGNANQSSSEPAVVYVMRDENSNSLPDDTWYLLAGSDYWFSKTTRNYEITYTNTGDTLAKDVLWVDNQGNSGFILANEFHSQTYYPLIDSFPDIAVDNYTLNGVRINDRMDKTMQDYINSSPFPFGYADNRSRNNNYSGWKPDNPYTKAIEGTGADGFDINWAIDANDNYVELAQIDFIKIQTGVNAMAGWLGEISTEVLGVVDVEPDNSLLGEEKLLIIEPINQTIKHGESMELHAFTFKSGRLQADENILWSSNNSEVALVNSNGILEALNEGACYIFANWKSHPEIRDSIKVKVPFLTSIGQKSKSDLIIYPNPVNDFLYVSENKGFTHFAVFNSFGKVLISSELHQNRIMLGGLNAGLYFIEFSNESSRLCKRIIKN